MADAERKTPHTWVTYVLIAANVVMFGVELLLGADPVNPTAGQLLEAGASAAPYTLDGEPWRLGSSMFLHYGVLHIGLNMLCLWQGRITELVYGRGAFTVLYVFSGLVGAVVAMVHQPYAVSAGASGAVFGVYGAFTAFVLARRATIPKEVWSGTMRAIGMFLVLNIVVGLSVPGISLAAHAGGFVFGFVGGFAILWKTEGPPRVARIVAVAVLGAALVAVPLAVMAVPQKPPPPATVETRAALTLLANEQTRLVALADSIAAGTPGPDAATRIANDVSIPWLTACIAFTNRSPVREHVTLFETVAELCEARQTSWLVLEKALRATGQERESLMLQHKVVESQVRKLLAAVRTEEQKLD